MFTSVAGSIFTMTLSIPSVVYRARGEDSLLKQRFREEWEKYADEVGFLLRKSEDYESSISWPSSKVYPFLGFRHQLRRWYMAMSSKRR